MKKPAHRNTSKETSGYPDQEPVALIERIVKPTSNIKDTFCVRKGTKVFKVDSGLLSSPVNREGKPYISSHRDNQEGRPHPSSLPVDGEGKREGSSFPEDGEGKREGIYKYTAENVKSRVLVASRISEIYGEISEEQVFNLEVEEAHSFITGTCVIHNGGSVPQTVL